MNYPKTNNIAPLRFLSPLHKATRRIGDHLAAHFFRGDLSSTEAHLLSYLRSYGPCPIGAVVQVFGLKKSTLTGITDRLVERGFLTRKINPGDRRSFLLRLTAKGRRRADRVREALDAFEDGIAAELTAADLRGFKTVMDAITRATASDNEGGPYR